MQSWLESRVPISKVACGFCSLSSKRPMLWSGEIPQVTMFFLRNSASAKGVVGGVLHLPLASSKLKWLQASWSGRNNPRRLVIEGDQCF